MPDQPGSTGRLKKPGWVHFAELGEREQLFLSNPSLVLEGGVLAKRCIKNLCRVQMFLVSHSLSMKVGFPWFFQSDLCRKLSTGTPNGSPVTKGGWGFSCLWKTCLPNACQTARAHFKMKTTNVFFFYTNRVKDYVCSSVRQDCWSWHLLCSPTTLSYSFLAWSEF